MQPSSNRQDQWPDITRPDVGIIVMAEWVVKKKREQVNAADVAMQERAQLPWPKGLLSHSCYLGMDRYSIFHYMQWKDIDHSEQFSKPGSSHNGKEIAAQIALTSKGNLGTFRLYRSVVHSSAFIPGCLVLVHREYKTREIAKRFVETVAEAVASEQDNQSAKVSAHLHLSTEGAIVVNYAEWESERAYEHFFEQSSNNTFIGLSPLWKKVRGFEEKPIANSFKKYAFYRSQLHESHARP
jgi:hypothetical protein